MAAHANGFRENQWKFTLMEYLCRDVFSGDDFGNIFRTAIENSRTGSWRSIWIYCRNSCSSGGASDVLFFWRIFHSPDTNRIAGFHFELEQWINLANFEPTIYFWRSSICSKIMVKKYEQENQNAGLDRTSSSWAAQFPVTRHMVPPFKLPPAVRTVMEPLNVVRSWNMKN